MIAKSLLKNSCIIGNEHVLSANDLKKADSRILNTINGVIFCCQEEYVLNIEKLSKKTKNRDQPLHGGLSENGDLSKSKIKHLFIFINFVLTCDYSSIWSVEHFVPILTYIIVSSLNMATSLCFLL